MPAVNTLSGTASPTPSSKETANSLNVVDELMKSLSISKTADETKGAAANIATLLHGPIEDRVVPSR